MPGLVNPLRDIIQQPLADGSVDEIYVEGSSTYQLFQERFDTRVVSDKKTIDIFAATRPQAKWLNADFAWEYCQYLMLDSTVKLNSVLNGPLAPLGRGLG